MTQVPTPEQSGVGAVRERFPAIDPKGIDMSEPITQQLPGKVPAAFAKSIPVFSEEPIGVAVLDPVDPAFDPFEAQAIDDPEEELRRADAAAVEDDDLDDDDEEDIDEDD